MIRRVRRGVHVGRWLGPWSPADRQPSYVRVQDIRYDGVLARRYIPTRTKPRDLLLLVPGLHYRGIDDPRFARLAHVFAASGRVVVAPSLDDYRALRVTPRVREQTEVVLAGALEDARVAIGDNDITATVFSVSFGSLCAFQAAGGAHAQHVQRVITFGGYGNWDDAVMFALRGEIEGRVVAQSDPLNRPVVYINLGETLPHVAPHIDVLRPQWLAFCRRTWGQPEMKQAAHWHPVAQALAKELPEPLRPVFLEGCGCVDAPTLQAGDEACRTAMSDPRWQHLDPTPLLANIACPVHVLHGRADDVIPPTQVDAIVSALPVDTPRKVYLTGLYAHTTGEGGVPFGARAREAWTLLRMIGALSN